LQPHLTAIKANQWLKRTFAKFGKIAFRKKRLEAQIALSLFWLYVSPKSTLPQVIPRFKGGFASQENRENQSDDCG
jgi:hypothetical protein